METRTFIFRWLRAASSMMRHEEALSRLDLEIGDGDHGVTIARGYAALCEDPQLAACESLEDFFQRGGELIAARMGGAIGPIYGLYYQAHAEAFAGAAEAGVPGLAAAANAAVERIGRICRVKPGDKTVLDAMAPAAEALAANARAPLEDALASACRAAREGRDATKDMRARKGRARFLGEKSIGHVDAGASSYALWLEALLASMGEPE